jgi:hypothetical protein
MFTLSNINKLTPVYKNRFEVNFENEILNNHCSRISDKHIWFYLNVIDGDIIPVNLIKNIITNKINLNIEITIISSVGEILSFIYLEGVTLLKLKRLIDFDYNDDSDIIKIKVKYKCVNQKTFINFNEIKNYRRKKKIEKINQL